MWSKGEEASLQLFTLFSMKCAFVFCRLYTRHLLCVAFMTQNVNREQEIKQPWFDFFLSVLHVCSRRLIKQSVCFLYSRLCGKQTLLDEFQWEDAWWTQGLIVNTFSWWSCLYSSLLQHLIVIDMLSLHCNLCLGLQLRIFIIEISLDNFLDLWFSHLVCKMLKDETSNVFFLVPTNSPRPKDIQFTTI